uniref:HAT C-terminal dimerisation domain-containing protein n=1 Tax=Lactuca sativa TaxID=4236 RepID=A0A9R1W643_LACSA|nr:hypothetical protein LSAT_V11C300145750 [Lactuca sativa]
MFAIKILGRTCSASACEQNWSTFKVVHIKRRNLFSTSKLNNLVYIMYNKMLKKKFVLKNKLGESDNHLLVEEVPSSDEWLADRSDKDDENGGEVGTREEIAMEVGTDASLDQRGGSSLN